MVYITIIGIFNLVWSYNGFVLAQTLTNGMTFSELFPSQVSQDITPTISQPILSSYITDNGIKPMISKPTDLLTPPLESELQTLMEDVNTNMQSLQEETSVFGFSATTVKYTDISDTDIQGNGFDVSTTQLSSTLAGVTLHTTEDEGTEQITKSISANGATSQAATSPLLLTTVKETDAPKFTVGEENSTESELKFNQTLSVATVLSTEYITSIDDLAVDNSIFTSTVPSVSTPYVSTNKDDDLTTYSINVDNTSSTDNPTELAYTNYSQGTSPVPSTVTDRMTTANLSLLTNSEDEFSESLASMPRTVTSIKSTSTKSSQTPAFTTEYAIFTSESPGILGTTVATKSEEFILEFSGDCTLVVGQLVETFLDMLRNRIADMNNIKKKQVELSRPYCGSILVNVSVTELPLQTSAIETLKQQTDILVIALSINNTTNMNLTLIAVMAANSAAVQYAHGLSSTALILIIVLSIVGFVLLLSFIMLTVHLCSRGTKESFYLGDTPEPHIRLDDYTLTRMSRPQYVYTDNGILIRNDIKTNTKSRDTTSGVNGKNTSQENMVEVESIALDDRTEATGTDPKYGHDNLSYSSDDILD